MDVQVHRLPQGTSPAEDRFALVRPGSASDTENEAHTRAIFYFGGESGDDIRAACRAVAWAKDAGVEAVHLAEDNCSLAADSRAPCGGCGLRAFGPFKTCC
ncbi:MAG TPA: hypothetical protein VG387_04525 [Rhizomicrobium sp.]|jgi:hypothetical protein|nr:hypothetical protein [Rhizomicrobium sp.]